MTNKFEVKCDCGAVTLAISGIAKVHGFCHCVDCRDLLDIPYHSVAVWGKEDVTFKEGEGRVSTFQHPTKRMKRIFCSNCGEVLFNTNVLDWRVISQQLISKNNNGAVPDALIPDKHIFYEQRIVSIDDDLPKYLRGTSGALYEESS